MKLLDEGFQKLEHEQDRQLYRQTDKHRQTDTQTQLNALTP